MYYIKQIRTRLKKSKKTSEGKASTCIQASIAGVVGYDYCNLLKHRKGYVPTYTNTYAILTNTESVNKIYMN
ncbi:hypothetical protein DOY81_008202, partial [Sarcophaga bullata]